MFYVGQLRNRMETVIKVGGKEEWQGWIRLSRRYFPRCITREHTRTCSQKLQEDYKKPCIITDIADRHVVEMFFKKKIIGGLEAHTFVFCFNYLFVTDCVNYYM